MGGQMDEMLLSGVVPEALGPLVNTTSSLPPGMDLDFSWDTMLLEDTIWGIQPLEETNPGADPIQLPPSSDAPETNRPEWKGSCEITTAKRNMLEQDVQAVFPQVGRPLWRPVNWCSP